MTSPLDQEAPGLGKKLESLSLQAQRSILVRACAVASKCLENPDTHIRRLLQAVETNGGLSKDEIAQAQSMAEIADAKYMELQERGIDQHHSLVLFSEARFLTAMAVGFAEKSVKNCADAIYELCKTCDDPAELIQSIESEIDSFLRK